MSGAMMRNREWQVAIFGTFDVQNYGDLLFPLLAEAELARRLGRVKLHRFSYHAKKPPDWPYTVTSVTDLPAIAAGLDGVLIGGGFIIRFDKFVAAGYGPPAPGIHHPTGYWLTPALIALQHGIPLIWNAPGMHCNDIPAWAEPILKPALEHSRRITVRDQPSQASLAPFVDKARITVLPDTAFGIPRLIDERRPSSGFIRLREDAGLNGPYIIVQPTVGLDRFLQMSRNHARLFRGFHILVLPIGPVLGDHEDKAGDALPGVVRVPSWPHPLLIAELISHAEAVVGHSYHLAITALAFGVPVFSTADPSAGKYTSLSHFESMHFLPKDAVIDPGWFMERLGKKTPSASARQALDQVDEHWRQTAAIIRDGSAATQPVVDRFWQYLPSLLEDASVRADTLKAQSVTHRRRAERLEAECMVCRERADELDRLLALANEQCAREAAAASELVQTLEAERSAHQRRYDELNALMVLGNEKSAREAAAAADCISRLEAGQSAQQRHIEELDRRVTLADAKIAALYNSRSMRVTAPLRLIVRNLRNLRNLAGR